MEVKINLSKYLQNNLGHLHIYAEPINYEGSYKPNIEHWIQVTKLAIDGISSAQSNYIWVEKKKKFFLNIYFLNRLIA
jgi:hypothetical protein